MRALALVVASGPLAALAEQQSPQWVDRDGVGAIGLAVRDSTLPLRIVRPYPWRTSEFTGTSFRPIAEGASGAGFGAIAAHAVYDHATQRTLVYSVTTGTSGGSPYYYADHSFFDGATWSVGQSTIGRIGTAMAFDPARGRILMFGGETTFWGLTYVLNDTSELIGSAWTGVATSGPSPRKYTAMARTATGLVLFGGRSASGQSYNDTWTWNGTAWSQATPGMAPSPRYGHVMSFDPRTGHTLLYGGQGLVVLGDTWRWTGTTWVLEASPVGPALTNPQLASADGRTWLVGQEGGMGSAQRVEEWDGAVWHPRLRRTLPPVRGAGAAVAADEHRHQLVMFGGRGSSGGYLGDTWTYGKSWLEHNVALAPSPRADAGTAFDRARGVTVLFGGLAPNYFGDTWLWNGTAWAAAQPTSSPSPRARAGLAFHPGRGTVLLHGGVGQPGTTALADTWEWDGATWSPVTTSSTAAMVSHLAYDETRAVMVLYQQHSTGSGWFAMHAEFVNNVWLPAGSAPLGDLAYDPEIGALSIHSSSERWSYGGGQWLSAPLVTAGGLVTDPVSGQLLGILGGFDVHVCSIVAARADTYGAGCGPVRPIVLGCSSRPFLGSEPRLDVACATPGAPAWLLLGLQSVSAPIAGSCTAYADVPVYVAGGTAGADGWARFPMAVPNNIALLGLTLYAQAVVADPAGLGFSNGMRLRVGW